MSQRDMMRNLIARYGRNENKVCAAYAAAESRGDVPRYSNKYALTNRRAGCHLAPEGPVLGQV
jgi:hypothetical protein